MDCSTMKPTAFRELVRSGRFTGQTSGVCNGYAQANLVILPKDLAFDFLLFATRNPKPCPILDVTEVGNPEPRLAAPGADLRYDIPKYRIYRHGEMAEEVATLAAFPLKDRSLTRALKYATSRKGTTFPCILRTANASPPASSMDQLLFLCAL